MARVINFTVGEVGSPADGTQIYSNTNIIGRNIKIFREGVFQFANGINYKRLFYGVIIFVPALSAPERISIIVE